MRLTHSIAAFLLTLLPQVALAQDSPQQKQALEALAKLDAKIGRDDNDPDQPVTSIWIEDRNLTDNDLSHVALFPELYWLTLHDAPISGAGLAHLQTLKKLQRLHIRGSKVTDANLAHLAGLTNLEDL